MQTFDKWDVDFVGPINPLGKRTGARYIITVTEYLTRWVQAASVVDSTIATTTKLIFEKM